MARKHNNQACPLVLSATGYLPYIEKRHEGCPRKHGRDKKSHEKELALKEHWVREQTQMMLEDYIKSHEKDVFRNQWECTADKKGLHSRVRWEMDKMLEQRQIDVANRRQRLKELFLSDENQYCSEMSGVVLPPEAKTAQMLERYKSIMVQKELKRQKLADEKREQQFRLNSHDLRKIVSMKVCHLIDEERKGQQNMKRKEHLQNNEDDKMFAEAWCLDSQAKFAKEMEEEKIRKGINERFARVLREQIADNRDRRAKQALVSPDEDESTLMDEQRRLLELEREWEFAEKKLAQERRRKELDECLQDKLKNRVKEVQEDLMLDMYFLDKIIEADVELKQRNEKKKALKKERDEYMVYLADQVKKEEAFEKEIEKMYKEESEKMWVRREREWEANKRMRAALNKKLVGELKEQVRNKVEKCRLAEEVKVQYDEEVLKQVEINRRRVEEQERQAREKNIQNQRELLQQIDERKIMAEELKERKRLEDEYRQKELIDYDNKLVQSLEAVHIDHLHPFRSRFAQ